LDELIKNKSHVKWSAKCQLLYENHYFKK